VILAKSSCIIAGTDVAAETFRQLDPSVCFDVKRPDGSRCQPGDVVAEVRGSAASMLTAERTALNFLQRLSGIATLTRRYVDAAAGGITILDTRKTTPTLRALEKYAVRAGGGTNHRAGLDDGILIKDNHVRLAGGVAEALARMKAARPEMPIEVEAQSLADVDAAVAAGADIILLDNLSNDEIRQAIQTIGGRAQVEISGGVTLDRIPELARTGANYVSIGALTHSAQAADLSFELALDG
jgi:nicotinate-nucleotide pyrophosphorylase (carboxylating)